MRVFPVCVAAAMFHILTVPASAQNPSTAESASASPAAVGAMTLTVTGPYSHENLTIFLVHGRDSTPSVTFTTLQEGIESKKLRVEETGDVGALQIENLSSDEIYIESGEIVRGGKQDRLLAVDLILEPGSGKVPIVSFCVEQGRWAQRGGESVSGFSSSTNQVSDNNIKYAAKRSKNQGEVWSGVGATQRKLGRNLKSDVTSPASESSLELTLEHESVKSKTGEYTRAILSQIDGTRDTLGLVTVLNGKLYSADIYATSNLFLKKRQKLLDAAAVAAISTLDETRANQPPSIDAARAFLVAAAGEQGQRESISKRVFMTYRETGSVGLFETFDTKHGVCIHINCLARETAPESQPASQTEPRQQGPR